jgi:hypothetical protein
VVTPAEPTSAAAPSSPPANPSPNPPAVQQPADPTAAAPRQDIPGRPLLPPPDAPIDPETLDPNNPPRFFAPVDDGLIPEGWVQVRKIDPDTGEEYWTLEPDELPMGLRLPKTGGEFVRNGGVSLLLGLCLLAGIGAGVPKWNKILKK